MTSWNWLLTRSCWGRCSFTRTSKPISAGPTPSIQFQITPYAVGDKVKSVLLEIDGQNVGFQKKGGRSTPVTIPGVAERGAGSDQ